jgi:hypothetical protein
MLVTVIIIVVVLLALAAVGGYFYRGQRLRKRFGPEYDRMVQDSGSRFRPSWCWAAGRRGTTA